MTRKATIIDGKKIASSILTDLKNKIDRDLELGRPKVKLAIILVGDDPASNIYVKNKIRAAKKVGIETRFEKLENNISEQDLLSRIESLNKDSSVSGIIVQLPIPKIMSRARVIKAIDPAKDVDGFHPINLGLLFSPFEHAFVPCTAMGCLHLIKSYCSVLTGKKVVVIGRSNIVGRPISALLLKENCSVTICHSHTINLSDITKKADIVISAVGIPRFLTVDYFNENAIVIDVGINRIESDGEYELCGDVDFTTVSQKVKYITPVPGGVGPMTVAYLLVNTYAAEFGLDSVKNI